MSAAMIENARLLSKVDPPDAFSWRGSAKCDAWLLVHGSTVEVVPFAVENRREAIRAARRRGWHLLVVWTGQWRSDTFVADVLPDEGAF